jgi:uncharacterized protein (TIGR04141 family)
MTSTSRKSNIAIWKIDESFLVERTAGKFVAQFQRDMNKGLTDDDQNRLKEIAFDSEKTADLDVDYIELLGRKQRTTGWYDFMYPMLSGKYTAGKDDPSYGLDTFSTERVDLVLFVGLGGRKLYCITVGSGYYLVEQYLDDTYSFDIAKRMFVGDVKESSTRAITGQKFAESVSYRTDYGVNSSEAFGKIWKRLRGPLDKDFIKQRSVLDNLLDVGRSPQAEAKASFTLKKSLSIQELVTLVKELDSISHLKLSDQKKAVFRFLDMAKPIRDPALKEKLQNELLEKVFSDVTADTTHCYELDFCHPKNVSEFFGADTHSFQVGHKYKAEFSLDGENAPNSRDVIERLREVEELKTGKKSFKTTFEKIKYYVRPEQDDDWKQFSAPLWQYFHGEIEYGGATYFLIDKVWYLAKTEFLEALKEYFEETVNRDSILQSSIDFVPYPPKDTSKKHDNRENRFNRIQAEKNNFWYGDMQYARYGKGTVELFDLLHTTEDTTYIIQSKESFDGAMRDACSQIKMSAQAIHGDMANGKKMLRAYYDKWAAAGHAKDLSKQDFLKLFSKSRRLVFVIAPATKHELTMTNLLDDKKFYSHICKI